MNPPRPPVASPQNSVSTLNSVSTQSHELRCSSGPQADSSSSTRRQCLKRLMATSGATAAIGANLLFLGLPGCIGSANPTATPDAVWGRMGFSEGRLTKPRAIAISPQDELYIVDIMGRIQVFDADGTFLRGWRTPEIKQGKPTGLGFSQDGNLLVADTHYFRMLVYSPSGELDDSRTIGGEHGDAPGQFHFVTDIVQDQRNHFFIGQYGQIDHIQEFAPDGTYIQTFGSQGGLPGEFSRPQCLKLDAQGLLWVADACNHRVQVFDVSSGGTPKLVHLWGTPGAGPGQLQYPYGLVFDTDGTVLIAEYGNHRVQRLDQEGRSLEMWGGPGKEAGQFNSPWALAIDSQRRLHVLDSLNHRVQRFQLG